MTSLSLSLSLLLLAYDIRNAYNSFYVQALVFTSPGRTASEPYNCLVSNCLRPRRTGASNASISFCMLRPRRGRTQWRRMPISHPNGERSITIESEIENDESGFKPSDILLFFFFRASFGLGIA